MSEQDRARQLLFRQLTQIPHRDIAPMVKGFSEALSENPDFIARAMVYLNMGGSNIRDQQVSAIITLLQADPSFPEYREAGRSLFLGKDFYEVEPEVNGLAPQEIFRVLRYITASDRKTPRLLKGIVRDYLGELEKSPKRWDGVTVHNRADVRWAYAHFHVSMSDRTKAILYDDNPPEDSLLYHVRQVARTKTQAEKAQLVMEYRVPFRVATSLLGEINALSGTALIDVMSPQEALNSRGWVEQKGLLNIPEVRKVYEAKVAKATKSVATTKGRKSAQGKDEGVQKAVEQAREQAVKQTQRIQGDVLLMIDRSGSMTATIGIAQQFCSNIAPLCDGEFMAVAFNDYGQKLDIDRESLDNTEKVFKGIRPGGGTSMRAGLQVALDAGFEPHYAVVVTDGGENQGVYAELLARQNFQTHTICLQVPGERDWVDPNRFVQSLEQAGQRVDNFRVDGQDYYMLDQVSALLGGPPAKSIVQRILDTPLPHRVNWNGNSVA